MNHAGVSLAPSANAFFAVASGSSGFRFTLLSDFLRDSTFPLPSQRMTMAFLPFQIPPGLVSSVSYTGGVVPGLNPEARSGQRA